MITNRTYHIDFLKKQITVNLCGLNLQKLGGKNCQSEMPSTCFRGTSEINACVLHLIFDSVLLVINSGFFCCTMKTTFEIL